ncbi:MAG: hypothetical protein DA405_07990 [Bacteroidetes bacterium]|nr:MAG: hypothetical protein DA405_07990 [Bacteroidota bacterium]
MKVLRKIGSGGISDVYHVANGDQNYAFKTLNHFKSSDDKAQLRLKNEYYTLKRIEHENIIKCINWIRLKNREGILMELFEGVELNKLSGQKLSNEIFMKIEEAIIYINEMQPPIFHNDITEKNILISRDGKIRIIDFSMSYSGGLNYHNMDNKNCLGCDRPKLEIIRTKYFKR